jgi:proline iminopeptidase
MTTAMIELDDGVQLRTWTTGSASPQTFPVVMVHGGPGVPDYLAPVAGIIDDLCLVHRYDQRGTGGSSWEGEHTIARHVHDLELLLDAWRHKRVVLMGHSCMWRPVRYGARSEPIWPATSCWPIPSAWPD